jgi:hypothetical protein
LAALLTRFSSTNLNSETKKFWGRSDDTSFHSNGSIYTVNLTFLWDVARMGEVRNIHRILVRKLQWKKHLQDLGVDRSQRNRIHLAQNRDQWRALVNTVMNPRIPYNAGNSSLAVQLLPSHEEPSFMQSVLYILILTFL